MKDKYEGCYIDGYNGHYAVFADNGEKLAEYDTHKEAKEDIAEWEAEVKNESYIPADTIATGYRFTIRETELLENAIKKHVEQKVDQGVNAMFDTDSEEFKKGGNEPYDKSQWWDDMKLTMRIKKTPYPRKNGYTNGDFKPNQKWLMGAIECCKSARDCDYLLKDAYLSVAHDKKLIQNLKSVRDGNPNKNVNVKVVQKWLDNGVTPEKVEKHIEWFKANYIKGLQAKKKEFNKTQNETVTKDPMNEDHSEISNDPEMEELMALAGVTTADLDDLENDNDLDLDEDDPIDANTLREIDAAMDESFLGIKSKKEKNAKEVTKAEFDKLINDMISINVIIISKLKTTKWWKIIFEPCYNNRYYKTPEIHEKASNFKRDFSAGKYVKPVFSSTFVNISDPNPDIYADLIAKNAKSPNDDEAYEKAFDNAYYESKKIIKEAIKKLGFNDDGKSTKYPDIKVSVGDNEYIYIRIEPIYNGYYKLKNTKKSQNESVETDLDILLAESAEFLLEE